MPQLEPEHSVVATYDTHTSAELAVRALQVGGVDMKRLSIIGRDFHTEEHALGFYTTGDRIKFWGGRGALWGSLWGMFFGGAFFLLPALGPLVVMGPMVGWLVGALEGAAIGGAAGALAAALTSINIPADSVVKYELEVKAGRFLVVAHGPAEMVEHARSVLMTTGPTQLHSHGAVHAKAARATYTARASILTLLSDDEVAKVSRIESAARLANGEEYVDLEQLERGVQQARDSTAMAHVLPRAAVQADTWKRILAQLPTQPPPRNEIA